MFFLWTYDEQSLKDFTGFIKKYSKNMKSMLKYDVYYSTEEVTFLDCKVKISNRDVETKLFTKHICIFWLRHAIQNTESMVNPRDNLLELGIFALH